MVNGYFNQTVKTAEAEWYDRSLNRFIRTGDLGRFDADGFLTLMYRKEDAAVVGVPSRAWGETLVASAVLRPGAAVSG